MFPNPLIPRIAVQDRGDLEAAREAITLDLDRYEETLGFRCLRAARARRYLALGKPDEALRELSELGDRRGDELGTRAELAPHWPPLAVRALLAAEQRGEALSLAEKDVSVARAFGAPAIECCPTAFPVGGQHPRFRSRTTLSPSSPDSSAG